MNDFMIEYISDLVEKRQIHYKVAAEMVKEINKREKGRSIAKSFFENNRDIAVIGMAVKFPYAGNLEEFWEVLKNGVSCITEIPSLRWPLESFYDPTKQKENTSYSKWGGFIEGIEKFDADFFHISDEEAKNLDPQQRIFLQIAYEAFLMAGYPMKRLWGSNTGVFVGNRAGVYKGSEASSNKYKVINNMANFIPARISDFFSLKGPSINIDTACSSSLVSVHMACQSLLTGECDMAIAGGIELKVSPRSYISLSFAGALSPDDKSYVFDKKANGFVPGEGGGAVILKPLRQAYKDGDIVLGIIKGSAVNNDGHTMGITSPNLEGQKDVLRKAYRQCSVSPEDISYIETHGTGTTIGDPIEIKALKQTFGAFTNKKAFCAVGSVKTNMGHLDTAAGIASLIKVILSLQHKQLPATLNCDEPNPRFEIIDSPFYVNTKLSNWHSYNNKSRFAAISSFGFGGTNCHMVIAEGTNENLVRQANHNASQLFVLSAKSEDSLMQLIDSYVMYLEEAREYDLEAICSCAYLERDFFKHRIAVITSSVEDLKERLQEIKLSGNQNPYLYKGYLERKFVKAPVFLFTGQGAIYKGVSKVLSEKSSVYKKSLTECEEILRPHMNKSLTDYLFLEDSVRGELQQTEIMQPVTFAVGYSLYKMWEAMGLQPEVAMGHSVGEYIACCIAGMIDLKDALELLVCRGKLMQKLDTIGTMAAVFTDSSVINPIIDRLSYEERQRIGIAAFNSPANTVLSGKADILEKILGILKQSGIHSQYLRVSHAFHSKLMEPMLGEFGKALDKITFKKSHIPVMSNVTGELIYEIDKEYLLRHVQEPVHFASGIKKLHELGYCTYLEIGPGETLTNLVKSNLNNDYRAIKTLIKGSDDIESILQARGSLFCAGYNLPEYFINKSSQRKRVILPGYQFQEKSYWTEQNHKAEQIKGEFATNPNSILNTSDKNALSFKVNMKTDSTAVYYKKFYWDEVFLKDHVVLGKAMIAGMVWLEAVRTTVKDFMNREISGLQEVSFLKPLVIEMNEVKEVEITVVKRDTDLAEFQVKSLDDDGDWIIHTKGLAVSTANNLNSVKSNNVFALTNILRTLELRKDRTQIYDIFLNKIGIYHGPFFRGVNQVYYSEHTDLIVTELNLLDADSKSITEDMEIAKIYPLDTRLHPGLLDSAMQGMIVTVIDKKGAIINDSAFIPFYFKRIELYSGVGGKCFAIAQIKKKNDELIQYDITIVNDKGDNLLRITDAYAKKVPKKENQIKAVLEKQNLVLEEENIPAVMCYKYPVLNKLPSLDADVPYSKGTFLVFADNSNICREVISQLNSQGKHLIRVGYGKEYWKDGLDTYYINPIQEEDYQALFHDLKKERIEFEGIIHMWSLQENEYEADTLSSNRIIDIYEQKKVSGIHSIFYIAKAFTKAHWIKTRFFVLTRAIYPMLTDSVEIDICQAPILGLIRTIRNEIPMLNCQIIENDRYNELSGARLYTKEILSDTGNGHVLIRNGERYEIQYTDVEPKTEGVFNQFRTGGVYLVLGGLGGIGLALAGHLAKNQSKIHLVLISRNDRKDKKETEQLNFIRSKVLSLTIISADVTDLNKMAQVVNGIRSQYGQIHGIIYAAGIIADSFIINKELATFQKVVDTKAKGVLIIDELTKNDQLDFFVMFSSIASIQGIIGQADYASANAFLDCFSWYRRQNNRTGKSICINWGLWSKVGMGNNALTLENARKERVQLIDPIEGVEAFFHSISINKGQIIIYKGERPSMDEKKEKVEKPLVDRKKISDNMKKLLMQMVLEAVEKTEIAQVEWEESTFLEMGMDSADLVKMIANLELKLGLKLYPTLFFEYPTVDELSNYLSVECANQTYTGQVSILNSEVSNDEQFTIHKAAFRLDDILNKTKQVEAVPEALYTERISDNRAAKAPLEDTLKQIEKSTSREEEPVKEVDATVDTDMAIIGYALKLPGANNEEEFWENLKDGVDSVTKVPDNRWDADKLYSADSQAYGKTYCRQGGFIQDIEAFDPLFFNISPLEANVLDTKQRLMLEVAWESIEHAGYSGKKLPKRTGVFVGTSYNNYYSNIPEGENETPFASLGNGNPVVANRLSHLFNISGPSMVVDTYCSSSLVAIHLACQSILTGECEMALVGGAHTLSPNHYAVMSRVQALSATGRCKSFDDAADGYVPGEGAAAILIKPYRKALEEGDYIHAVIKSTAVNHCGHSNNLTSPNATSQEEVVYETYKKRNINPETISYIEAHGTGTSLGDPVEIKGITGGFQQFTDKRNFCAIGSVKTNIGHLEPASGIAGIIKVILALKHKTLPPTLNFRKANRFINFNETPFYINDKASYWHTIYQKRRAGVSAFGLTGTNAHIVLEEAPARVAGETEKKSSYIIALSAKNRESVTMLINRYGDFLNTNKKCLAADLMQTSLLGRIHFNYRVAVVAPSKEGLEDKLHLLSVIQEKELKDKKLPGIFVQREVTQHKLAWVFSDSLYYNAEIVELMSLNSFKIPYDFVMKKVESYSGFLGRQETPYRNSPLLQGFALQYAISCMLHTFGVMPDILTGYGYGKFLAAAISGILSVEDALYLSFLDGEGSNKEANDRKNLKEMLQGVNINKAQIPIVSEYQKRILYEEKPDFEFFLNNTAINQARKVLDQLCTEDKRYMVHIAKGNFYRYSEKEIYCVEPNEDLLPGIYRALAALYVSGLDVKWEALYENEAKHRIPIPTYPFNKSGHWLQIYNYEATDKILTEKESSKEEHRKSAVSPNHFKSALPHASVYNSEVIFTEKNWVVEQSDAKEAITESGVWVIFEDAYSVSDEIIKYIQAKNGCLIVVREGKDYQKIDSRHYVVNCLREDDFNKVIQEIKKDFGYITYLINLFSCSEPKECLVDSVVLKQSFYQTNYAMFFLAKAIAQHIESNYPEIILVSTDALYLKEAVYAALEKSTLPALLKVIRSEFACRCKLLDFAWEEFDSKSCAEIIIEELKAGENNSILMYRNGIRYREEVKKSRLDHHNRLRPLKNRGVYIVVGGSTGIGLHTAEYLAKRANARLVIIGRTKLPGKEEWKNIAEKYKTEEALSFRIKSLLKLEQAGGTVRYYDADITDFERMTQVIGEVKNEWGSINGVINSGGIKEDKLIRYKDFEIYKSVIHNKAVGTYILDTVTGHEELDFFVMYSSISAFTGNAGQADYASANAFLDNYAWKMRARTGRNYISINWPYWKEGGMVMPEGAVRAMINQGILPLETKEGLSALEQILMQEYPLSNVAVLKQTVSMDQDEEIKIASVEEENEMDIELYSASKLNRSYDVSNYNVSIKQDIDTDFKVNANNQLSINNHVGLNHHIGLNDATSTKIDTGAQIEVVIFTMLKELLLMKEEQLNKATRFDECGLDSLMLQKCVQYLEKKLRCSIEPGIFFEYPTIDKLSEYLKEHVDLSFMVEEFKKSSFEPRVKTLAAEIKQEQKVEECVTVYKSMEAISKVPDNKKEDIAIIGMALRFPGADSPEAFWENLSEGKHAIHAGLDTRWKKEDICRQFSIEVDKLDKVYTCVGGYLEEVDTFDASFFGISEEEAPYIDPQHRILLETVWKSIEHAGYSAQTLWGSNTGVFVGARGCVYQTDMDTSNSDLVRASLTGKLGNFNSARISDFYNLKGPSIVIDTACSSSLVSTHYACKSILDGECSLAISCGVEIKSSPDNVIGLSASKALSADGKSYVFDQRASGFVAGEGAGAIVLKSMRKAIEDGDTIYAVIKGSAVNNDGHTMGITTPDLEGQKAVIEAALENAEVDAATISYIEAHGTGTMLGDPIEVKALTKAFEKYTEHKGYCGIGSVKTNIGHLDTAAGIASIIKVILALQHKKIPPTLNIEIPNKRFRFVDSPFYPVAYLEDWKLVQGVRRAGVSSFGFGGTNCHMILEEGRENQYLDQEENDRSRQLFLLSAKSGGALEKAAETYANYLAKRESENLGNICYTTGTSRRFFDNRLALICSDTKELKEKLKGIEFLTGESKTPGKVTFLFTGQGALYSNLAKELYERQPVFKEALNSCDRIFNQLSGTSLLALLYESDGTVLKETAVTQPVTFAISYALARMWMAFGVTPEAVLGHSAGEYAAACIAGTFSLEDGLKLITWRGKLMQEKCRRGAMAALMCSRERAEDFLKELTEEEQKTVSIGAYNGETNTVISGEQETIAILIKKAEAEKIRAVYLEVSHGFHSPMMLPMLRDYEKILEEVDFRENQIPIINGVTGERIKDQILSKEYWLQHVLAPVNFYKAIKTCEAEGMEILLEVGAGNILSNMAKKIINKKDICIMPTLVRGGSDWHTIQEAMASLYVRGVTLKYEVYDKGYQRRRIALPTYPFNGKKYWATRKTALKREVEIGTDTNRAFDLPVCFHSCELLTMEKTVLTFEFLNEDRFLKDHIIGGQSTIAGVIYWDLALQAAGYAIGTEYITLREVTLKAEWKSSSQKTFAGRVIVSRQNGEYRFVIESKDEKGVSTKHCTGKIQTDSNKDIDCAEIKVLKNKLNKEVIVSEDIYAAFSEKEMAYGSAFKSIQKVWIDDMECLARINLPDAAKSFSQRFKYNPSIVDGALQAVICTQPIKKQSGNNAYLPFFIEEVTCYKALPESCYSHIRVVEDTSGGELIKANVDIRNEQGELLIGIKNFCLKKLNTGTLFSKSVIKSQVKLTAPVWKERSITPLKDKVILPEKLVLFMDFNREHEVFAQKLRDKSLDVVSVYMGDEFEEIAENKYVIDVGNKKSYTKLFELLKDKEFQAADICHLWNYTTEQKQVSSLEELEKSLTLGAYSLYFIVQALYELRIKANIKIICNHSVVFKEESVVPEKAVLLGIANVMNQENVGVKCFSIDSLKEECSLYDVFLTEVNNTTEHLVVYREKKRWTWELERIKEDGLLTGINFKTGGTYLITGGLGGIGIEIAKWIAESHKCKIALLGRSRQEDLPETELQIMEQLNSMGANVRYYSADVSDEDSLKAGINRVTEELGNITGIIHGAGIVKDCISVNSTLSKVKEVFAPKVRGTWLLNKLFCNKELDFMILFSGMVCFYPNAGQSAYTGANMYMDAFAHNRQYQEQQRTAVVNWWFWGETGMAAKPDITEALKRRKLIPLTNTEGVQAFRQMLSLGRVQTLVTKIEEESTGKEAKKESRDKSAKTDGIRFIKQERNIASLQTSITTYLTEKMEQLAEITIDFSDRDTAFLDMGVDSIFLINLSGELEKDAGIMLYPTVFFEHNNLTKLSAYLESDYREEFEKMFMSQQDAVLVEEEKYSIQKEEPELLSELYDVEAGTKACEIRGLEEQEEEVSSEHMKAVLFTGPGNFNHLVIDQMQMPKPGPSEVIIKVKASGVNFSDVLTVLGNYPNASTVYPYVLGNEVSGIVQEIGSQVKNYKIGQEVIGLTNGTGGFAQFVNVDESTVWEKPQYMDFAQAASLPIVFLTAYHCLHYLGKIQENDTILIRGAAGGVGLMAIQLAKAAKAKIIGAVGSKEKAAYLKSIGVDYPVNYLEEDIIAYVKQVTKQKGVDLLLTSSAGGEIEELMKLVASNGRFLEMGMAGLRTAPKIDLGIFVNNQSFFSMDLKRLRSELLNHHAGVMRKMLRNKQLQPIHIKEFPYTDIGSAFSYMASRRNIGKVIVTFPEIKVPDKNKIDGIEKNDVTCQDIAVIGMSGAFPEAPNLEQYWENLCQSKDSVGSFPEHRRALLGLPEDYDLRSLKGGFLENIDLFDPMFFHISPAEAIVMDPQQRLFMLKTWEAIESAGYGGTGVLPEDTSVYVGVSRRDYHKILEDIPNQSGGYSVIGNTHSVLASRISYWLNLKGPAIAVDTACSSSIVALHLACESILSGQCSAAIAGGINLLITPDSVKAFQTMNALSVDAKCKPFDKSADGFVSSEGVGVLVLKALERAVEDGDRIHAVIKGSALNNDGASNGITAPNPAAQAEVIEKALEKAGVTPETISYMETHGTGTYIGDPIEIEALSKVYEGALKKSSTPIGSVKSNIGHAEAAAGISSVIKVILSMKNRILPPSIHFHVMNPILCLQKTPFFVNEKVRSWDGDILRAGVSSFGFSGTNGHVIIEGADGTNNHSVNVDTKEYIPYCFTLSAANKQVLKKFAQLFIDMLQTNRNMNLGDLCFTTAVGKRQLNTRLAIVADTVEELQEKLIQYCASSEREHPKKTGKKIALNYSGFSDSAATLATTFDSRIFTDSMEKCYEMLQDFKTEEYKEKEEDLKRLFLVYATGQVLESLGIIPAYIIAGGAEILGAMALSGGISVKEAIMLIIQGKGTVEVKDGRYPVVSVLKHKIITSNPQLLHCYTEIKQIDVSNKQILDYIDSSKADNILCFENEQKIGITDTIVESVQLDNPFIHCLLAERKDFLEVIASLYVKGYDLVLQGLYHSRKYKRVSLPTYPFQLKSYWLACSVKNACTEEKIEIPVIDTKNIVSEVHVDRELRDKETEVLIKVKELIAKLLITESCDLDVETDFGEYGMDSMLIKEATLLFEREFNMVIESSIFIEYPTIAALAEYVAGREKTAIRDNRKAEGTKEADTDGICLYGDGNEEGTGKDSLPSVISEFLNGNLDRESAAMRIAEQINNRGILRFS
ncbi:hypothetical protein acsn021_19840 [Anaerocolumna cellulosilytica]|uniref:Uncharacterized protein n=1 Tax=Anaerocolumna cellulosilytica TaxID=433286 RepID=A0A6S6R4Q4_9FIRM|nr:type I polyketide synthase [Anaerocolumna cellulosilytica]MBB5196463.1 acyl transferase domain-containing protein/D-arabinose 1-dehydrogenase-like Zn-dependent alcohol dehydrogenase [Anaerocolumna cellulosilytica]BCJ94415.1 hypothetical protein acsn021_19840 [Anaerocolumna cellulosilytica]